VRLLHHAVHNPHSGHLFGAHSILAVDAGNRPSGRSVIGARYNSTSEANA
jgi:hypothetical protein